MMLVGASNVKAQEQEQNRVLAVDPYETTLDFWPRTGTLNVVTENFTLNVEHDPTSFEWFVCDEQGNYREYDDRPDLYDWITLSFSKDKKTIIYTVTGNTSGESRTAQFKLRFYLWNEEFTIYSGMVTITQAHHEGPLLDLHPDEVVLESSAKGIEGTMAVTLYNLPYDIESSSILWDNKIYHEWIEANYNEESKTVTYKTVKENDDTEWSPTAKFQLLYSYHDNAGEYHNLHSDWVTVKQPAAPILNVVPIDATIGYESQKTATMQISAATDTDIDLNNAEFSRIKWLKNVQGDEISKPDWIDVSLSENKQAMTLTTLEKNETGQPRTTHFKLFLKYNDEEICSDYLSVTQNPSTNIELTYTPSELNSNAQDLTQL